jgi:acetate kinase
MGIHILTINTGSSSLKAGLYALESRVDQGDDPQPTRVLAAHVERIGAPGAAGGRLRVVDAHDATLLAQPCDLPDHGSALRAVLAAFDSLGLCGALAAIGHRVVHGGAEHREPEVVTPDLCDALRQLLPIDPDHLPQAIAAIELLGQVYPRVAQVACFDTAFHRHMPRVAQLYALPRRYWDDGVRRYGFHGLSCESILRALRAEDSVAARGRVIVAHLGNGASMTAVRGGIGLDTTMGFTPTGGLVMGTRTGDLDPSVPLYLLHAHGMSPEALNRLVNQQAGLLGVSGSSADMRDLLAREAEDPEAAVAIALFCYQAKKYLGALTAVLGGLDTLVFTGGIGEHAAPIRARICADLEYLDILLDALRNAAHAPIISPDGASVVVRVIPTDEDRTIARHTFAVLRGAGRQ